MRTRKALAFAFVWALFVVVAVHFVQFPGSVPDFAAVSGGGTLLDAVPAFTPDAAYQRLAGYGEAGRSNYAFRNVTVDVLLPLSVLPFLFLLMLPAVTPLARHRIIRALLLSLPFVYVIFDLLENSAVLVLLANYPERLNVLAGSLAYVTMVKRVASLLALVAPLALWISARLRTAKH